MFSIRLWAATVVLGLFVSFALAQTDTNLPPVAAPTGHVQVQSIPVVRSASEQADDFVAGLLRGLTVDERVQGVAVAAAQGDHTILERSSGALPVSMSFPAARLRRVLDKTVPRFDALGGATTSVSNLLRLETALAKCCTISGFAEMRRNGWNALQLDSSEGGYSARLVIAPEEKLVYVIAMRGRVDWRVWRIADDAVYDELLPPKPRVAVADVKSAAVPPGVYAPERSLTFLKVPDRLLQVRAGGPNAIQLSGAENARLMNGPGIWTTADGSLTAMIQKDELLLSSGAVYRPVPFYRRPILYVLLLLAGILAGFGVMLRRAV